MKLQPLPIFDPIKPEEIQKASIFIFYGGNKLTEIVGNYIYKYPYWPASYHAAGGLGGTKLLNVAKKTTIEDITTMYDPAKRIDVIENLDLTDIERDIICRKFERDADNNTYDLIGYVRKGSKLHSLRFLKYVHASEKNDYCSDNVIDNFSEAPFRRKDDTDEIIKSLILPRYIQVSYESSEDSIPWGLVSFAMDKNFQNGTRRIRTLYTGDGFLAFQKKKFS